MNKNSAISLHIPPKMWSDFQKSMLKSRMFNEEVIGFLFCQRHQVSKRKIRYIPKTIEVKPDNTPRMYCRITVPPLGGGWCLMCGNIINLQRAALESAPLEINQMAAGAGYLEGVNDPAVFWLNSICASTGVGVIHGMVSGFLNVDSGIDWIYEFPGSDWRKTNTEYLQTDDCYFCGMGSLEEVVENSDFENSDSIIW